MNSFIGAGLKGFFNLTENKRLINLNWIEQYGLQVVEKDVETPLLVVPTELFNKLKKDME